MRGRIVFALAAFVSGCGLVSGLDSLNVGDAASSDDAQSPTDSTTPPNDSATDAITSVDGGDSAVSAGNALSVAKGCAASGFNVPLSGSDFSIELWLQVTGFPLGLAGLVWSGGTLKTMQGYSVDLNATGVALCVADLSGAFCTSAAAITKGDLVHIVATSTPSQTIGRTLNVYARDFSKNETTHTLLQTYTGAPNTWQDGLETLTIGGSLVGQSCSGGYNAFIDDVRIVNVAIAVAEMDSTSIAPQCLSASTLAEYTFEQDTTECSKSATTASTLELNAASIAASPFPYP